ncbi:hypothetical protein ACFQ9X_29745 [Catenulispora yoronensis]
MDSELLSSVMAQLTAALSAVGHKLLSTAGEKTADESVRLGRRLLDRLRRSKDGTRGPGWRRPSATSPTTRRTTTSARPCARSSSVPCPAPTRSTTPTWRRTWPACSRARA